MSAAIQDLEILPLQDRVAISVSKDGSVRLTQPRPESPTGDNCIEVALANLPTLIAALQKVVEG